MLFVKVIKMAPKVRKMRQRTENMMTADFGVGVGW